MNKDDQPLPSPALPDSRADEVVSPFVPALAWVFFAGPAQLEGVHALLLRRTLPPDESLIVLLQAVEYARRYGGPQVAWSAWRSAFAVLAEEPWRAPFLTRAVLLAACESDA